LRSYLAGARNSTVALTMTAIERSAIYHLE
jgi:hypothetical protein